jgi:hypothetical protein
MPRTQNQIAEDFRIMLIIDRRRAESGDPNLGSAIERVIVQRWLNDIERVSGPLPETRPVFAHVRRRTRRPATTG